MARIYWVREEEWTGEPALAAEKSWDWCEEQLGNLSYISPLDKPPRLTRGKDDRPEMAPFRGRQFVVVELTHPVRGQKAGFYLASVTPQQLNNKLTGG